MSDGMWDLTAILRKQYFPKSWHGCFIGKENGI